jgi:hypothetical protein
MGEKEKIKKDKINGSGGKVKAQERRISGALGDETPPAWLRPPVYGLKSPAQKVTDKVRERK